MLKSILKNLINQANFGSVQKNSYKNYHSELVDYYCLFRDNKLTIKLYHIKNSTDGKYLVNPHTHKYNFDTYILEGEVRNILFEEITHEKKNYFKYRVPSLISMGGTSLVELESSKIYMTGESYYMDANQIHTLSIIKPSYLVLFQYKTLHSNSNLFLPPNTDMKDIYKPTLYERMNESDIEKTLLTLRDRLL